MPSFTFAGEFFQQYNAARQFRLQAIEQARAVRAQRALEEHRAQVLELSRRAADLNESEEIRRQAQHALNEMKFAAAQQEEEVRREEARLDREIRRRNTAVQEQHAATAAARLRFEMDRPDRDIEEKYRGQTDAELEDQLRVLRGENVGAGLPPSLRARAERERTLSGRDTDAIAEIERVLDIRRQKRNEEFRRSPLGRFNLLPPPR